MGIITFFSDFGLKDGYVGAVKGRMLTLYPQAIIVDISHEANPYDIGSAAYNLFTYYNYFPKNTIHVAVVDPGVGGKRHPLLIRTANYTFIGPDNGLFSHILENEAYSAFIIDPARLKEFSGYQQGTGETFHARDIFGPVAALLARGESIEILISNVADRIILLDLSVKKKGDMLTANILSFDRFGNIITGLRKKHLEDIKKTGIAEVRYKTYIFNKLSATYSSVPVGEPLLLWGSSGFLEIAINQGNAVGFFNSDKNDRIEILVK